MIREAWPNAKAYAPAFTRSASFVDGMKAFIGSANLTDAAQLRNIEIGVVVVGTVAHAAERHIEALIADGHLRPLLLGR
jgi:phosphatidylserine/phosphatidylglycerophosphate/cardiolipin synthase-like enzyme